MPSSPKLFDVLSLPSASLICLAYIDLNVNFAALLLWKYNACQKSWNTGHDLHYKRAIVSPALSNNVV